MINYLINFSDEDYVSRVNLNSPKLMIWHNTKTDQIAGIHIFNFFDLNQQLCGSVQLANIAKDIHDIYKKVSTYLIGDNFNINDQQVSIKISCLQQLPFLINSNFTFLSRYIKPSYVDSAWLTLFDKNILRYTYIRCQENKIYDSDNQLDQAENSNDIKNMLLIWHKKMNKIITPYMLLNNIY